MFKCLTSIDAGMQTPIIPQNKGFVKNKVLFIHYVMGGATGHLLVTVLSKENVTTIAFYGNLGPGGVYLNDHLQLRSMLKYC